MHILVIGDKPSSKNIDPNIAFLGTPSFITLSKWLNYISPTSSYKLINSIDDCLKSKLRIASVLEVPIIILGNEAEKRVNKIGEYTYFKLPHPSPRNRKLNDKQYVIDILEECKQWLNLHTAKECKHEFISSYSTKCLECGKFFGENYNDNTSTKS